MFIVIEGMDGSGKGLQTEKLFEYLQSVKRQVRRVYDPGTTQLGQSIRQILLHQLDQKLSTNLETLLFMTARASLDEEITRLRSEQYDVVGDRWLASTIVYQVIAAYEDKTLRGEAWCRVGAIANAFLANRPDVCFVLNVPWEVAMARRAAQKERVDAPKDRFETRGEDWWKRLCDGYKLLTDVYPMEYVAIDGTGDPEEVHAHIIRECQSRISLFPAPSGA
jgi:dTMP kinase